ncbi:MAG: isoleucine--tRNA ligase [Bdellovibrionales bacterium]|nr:isoleucine--tRNA ligase [Bdellovibrionales bacterium]
MSLFSPVRPDVSLPKLEEDVLKFWDENQIFEKSLEAPAAQGKAKPYQFYDGPPFATGLPHYGHILAGTLKDIVPRYWTMKGYSIPRRFGWDCHGLPVENEINKQLKLESRKQILAYGVDKYNAACRSIVDRYSNEWKKTVRRVGRWVDMENAYFTKDVGFMQSVWWVFKQFHDKGLIYEGYKVVPYSTGISTPLSNFEANLNYKQVQDPAITVAFPLNGAAIVDHDAYKKLGIDQGAQLLAWTTTPWTLPSNLALAVHSDVDYVQAKEHSTGKKYILAEALLKSIFKDPSKDAEVELKFKGSSLVGLKYEPLFKFFEGKRAQGAFQVIHSDHVTTESGVGIVHMAPAFGEEDFFACQKAGIPIVNPVDDDGVFTSEVPTYQGKKVKEADKDIIADLKKAGRLIKQETYAHSYPFCYRTETPLIYRAVTSWFVKVEAIKDQMIAANKKTNWVPDHLRDGRFGNWLENARDWAISRNRFWGTPLPIWRNKEGEVICVGSRAELEKLSGKKIDDLHIDVVDQITIPSPTGKSPLKRIEGVLDCWFESGSMPFAQNGYPDSFASKAEADQYLDQHFPAEYIAEGLDQTRGWFYTLTVIGTALKGQSPFKNVVVNGLILAEDGKKMSKSLRNYPDPMELVDRHGADALRLYMIDSPVVRAQELRFSEVGVKEVVRRILLRWWNSYSFFVNYANIDQFKPKGDFDKSPNLLDQWLLSRLNTLVDQTQREMEGYRLYNVVPVLLQFVEELTNTYIRFNRRHFWQDGMPEEKRLAFETLYHALVTLSKVMAPFAPFLAETTYQNLKKGSPAKAQLSVHLEAFPEANKKLIQKDLEDAVRVMDALVLLGRNTREKIGIKAKIPLKTMKIIQRDKKVLENLKNFEPYFTDELNIRKFEYASNEDDFVQVTAKANFQVLGKKVGPKMKAIAAKIGSLGLQDLLKLEAGDSLTLEGEEINLSDVEIRRAPKGAAKPGQETIFVAPIVSIEIDPSVSDDQIREGLAREVVRKIQAARKSADFQLDDRIQLQLKCDGLLRQAVQDFEKMICGETLATNFSFSDDPQGKHREEVELDEGKIVIAVTAQPRK